MTRCTCRADAHFTIAGYVHYVRYVDQQNECVNDTKILREREEMLPHVNWFLVRRLLVKEACFAELPC